MKLAKYLMAGAVFGAALVMMAGKTVPSPNSYSEVAELAQQKDMIIRHIDSLHIQMLRGSISLKSFDKSVNVELKRLRSVKLQMDMKLAQITRK